MRSMAVQRFDEALVLLDRPKPTPGPRQVLVRVLACGVCRTDLKIVGGQMPFSKTQALPHVPGHEVAGEVESTGAGVSLSPGQRVVVFNYWGCGRCPYCMAGEENLCDALRGWVGFTSPGGFQEYLVVPADYAVPLPESIPATLGASLPCALGTSYHAVITRGGVRAGETVAILGAGGVGLHALQFARVAGARTVAIDIGDSKLAAARQLGADLVMRPEGAGQAVRDFTGGRGADLVVDFVGSGDSTSHAVDLARKGGRVVQVGYTTDASHYPLLPTERVTLREVSIVGSRYFTRPELAKVIGLVARGAIRPVVTEVLALTDANAALDRVRTDRAVGRIVLRVAEA